MCKYKTVMRLLRNWTPVRAKRLNITAVSNAILRGVCCMRILRSEVFRLDFRRFRFLFGRILDFPYCILFIKLENSKFFEGEFIMRCFGSEMGWIAYVLFVDYDH